MNLFQTTTFDITFAQARLLRVPSSTGVPIHPGAVPVVPTTSAVTAHVHQFRNISTRTTILELGPSVMGLTMVRTASDVVIVLYDIAEPAIRRWLEDGIKNGALRIAVQSDTHLGVVEVGVCDMTRWLGRLAKLSEQCSGDALYTAIDEVMTALHEPEGLHRLSLDDMSLGSVTLAVVTPLEEPRAAPVSSMN